MKRQHQLFTCKNCSTIKKDEGTIKRFFSQICWGRVAFFLGAVYIAVVQLFFT
ncbi:hypothetical protein HNQ35_000252 [Cerasibacillus quisquiliarum]|uniref:hypothetical protein n=1 Tax=Cerasibacillus quisquiliarum TaxID=227865 RepID=UPI001476CC81|nr:hypothetical protein [Cerasibacillus quisquiliarum]MBB5145063.1 hypothetical protein [Cerasibacillus quisquiliarum]